MKGSLNYNLLLSCNSRFLMASPVSTRDLLPLETKESITLDADDDYDVLGSPDIEVDEIDDASEGDGKH